MKWYARSIRQLLTIDHRARGRRIGRDSGGVRAQIEPLELSKKFVVVGGEVGYGLGKFVIRYQSGFVGGAEPGGNRNEAFLNLPRSPFGEVVINQDDSGERGRLGGEIGDLLLDALSVLARA